MPADDRDHPAGPHDRDRLLPHRHVAGPVRVALAADALLVVRRVQLRPPAARRPRCRPGRRGGRSARSTGGRARPRRSRDRAVAAPAARARGRRRTGRTTQLPVGQQQVQPVEVLADRGRCACCARSLSEGTPTSLRARAAVESSAVTSPARPTSRTAGPGGPRPAQPVAPVHPAQRSGRPTSRSSSTAPRACTSGTPTATATSTASPRCGSRCTATAYPEIDAAVRAQLDRLDHATFLGLTHEPGIELAERLLATAPAGLTRVFYAGDGSSAVEAAIKMAFQAQAQRGDGTPARRCTCTSPRATTATRSARSASAASTCSTRRTGRSCSTPGWSPPPACSRPARTRADRAAEVLAEMRAALVEADGDRCARWSIEPLVQAAGGMLTHDVSFVARRARPVRRVRRADGGRRGRHRHRPHRPDVGGRARRRDAGPA